MGYQACVAGRIAVVGENSPPVISNKHTCERRIQALPAAGVRGRTYDDFRKVPFPCRLPGKTGCGKNEGPERGGRRHRQSCKNNSLSSGARSSPWPGAVQEWHVPVGPADTVISTPRWSWPRRDPAGTVDGRARTPVAGNRTGRATPTGRSGRSAL